MTRHEKTVRWLTVLGIITLVPLSFMIGLNRIHVDADITSSIPKGDLVIDSASRLLGRHPALDLVTLDLHIDCSKSSKTNEGMRLVKAATYVERELLKSGLFHRVGMNNVEKAMPELFQLILDHLPQMFSTAELMRDISQLITPHAIEQALKDQIKKLSVLQGVGQVEAIKKDPLGFRGLVLGRMAALNPSRGAHLYNGHLLSADGCHLLILADPQKPGSDTNQARKILSLLHRIETRIPQNLHREKKIELTAIGAFRSALDNETIARADTKRALWIATLGVALLLLLCFPRPWLGLLALVPALAGVALALLVYSFLETSISALALGFGGALVTISVDHAIAYLQFLDRTPNITGRKASKEVWSVGLVAALTTVGAFLTLYLSGITMLGEVGLFAALGVGLSFVFVHVVFPLLFPEIKSSTKTSILPIVPILGKLTRGRSWIPFGLALIFGLGMLFMGQPVFRADLQSMNTVTQETRDAESMFKKAWGDIFNRTYLLAEQPTIEKLRQRTDALVSLLNDNMAMKTIKSGFSPSMILPGTKLARKNIRAWRKFFTRKKINRISSDLQRVGTKLGFSPNAFAPFISSLAGKDLKPISIPENLYPILGITQTRNHNWIWVGSLEPGKKYDSDSLYLQAQKAGLSVFDPGLFSQHMSRLLGSSFLRMLLVVGGAVAILLVVMFMDATLVFISLLPLGFALACTMGFMKLFNHPMDIPSLMLGVVVLGMGVDYSLYFVKAQQRYFRSDSPAMAPIRVAVFLAASSTLVGLGTLAMADHSVAHSAGFTTLLGIGFSLLGAFVILPPLLNRLFAPRPFDAVDAEPGSPAHLRAVRKRYAHLEPSVRLFARFKLLLDPMFPRLAQLAAPTKNIERVLDIGCGYGLPSCYLAALLPNASFYEVEPDATKTRIAARVLGDRAKVKTLSATTWDISPDKFDLVLLLDVIHHLTDRELDTAISMVKRSLSPGAKLIIRADVPGHGRFAWERWIESLRLRVKGIRPIFRSAPQIESALRHAEFELQLTEPCAQGREETWFVATTPKEHGA